MLSSWKSLCLILIYLLKGINAVPQDSQRSPGSVIPFQKDESLSGFHDPMFNEGFFEGDIAGIDPNAGMNAVPQDNQRWPEATIPFEIDESLKEHSGSIQKAMDEIMKNSCIRFVQKTPEHRYFIRIFRGNGCWSSIGFSNVGQQDVSLTRGCESNNGAILHELMHAIGLQHEHNRSDRDEHLNILWQNIHENWRHAFKKLQPHENKIFTPFDFDSIMLYGPYIFSKKPGELKTMEGKNGRIVPETSDKKGLSPSDIKKLKILYACKK